jgi:high-affinity iron transporter
VLDAVIIVLRETLEASLLVSFLFVYSNHFSVNKKWMFLALVLGISFAVLVALQLPEISDLYDGTGQEVLFITVLLALSLLIQWINFIVIIPNYFKSSQQLLKILFSSIIVLAISLEGAEIIVFFQSSLANDKYFYANLLGSVLGLGIGISAGAVSYYLLNQLTNSGIIICLFLLVLVSAGMASQAISYLMQADFIESGYPVWNTNAVINERSIIGQLLYALMGYEATPSFAQVIAYFGYVIIPSVSFIYFKKFSVRKN